MSTYMAYVVNFSDYTIIPLSLLYKTGLHFSIDPNPFTFNNPRQFGL
jgi:hypothetical protein